MKKNLLIKIGLTTLMILATTSLAQAYTISEDLRPDNEPFSIGAIIGGGDAATGAVFILQILAGGLLYFAVPIGIIMIIISAFTIITGGAESEKFEQGKKHLIWSIVGLLTVILSFSIVRIIITLVASHIDASPLPDRQPPAATTKIENAYELRITPQYEEIEHLLS